MWDALNLYANCATWITDHLPSKETLKFCTIAALACSLGGQLQNSYNNGPVTVPNTWQHARVNQAIQNVCSYNAQDFSYDNLECENLLNRIYFRELDPKLLNISELAVRIDDPSGDEDFMEDTQKSLLGIDFAKGGEENVTLIFHAPTHKDHNLAFYQSIKKDAEAYQAISKTAPLHCEVVKNIAEMKETMEEIQAMGSKITNLIFSGHGNPEIMAFGEDLTANQILSLPLHDTQVVVLRGCSTGKGKKNLVKKIAKKTKGIKVIGATETAPVRIGYENGDIFLYNVDNNKKITYSKT